MFDYKPMPNYISDKNVIIYMIINFILALMFWALFMFVHNVFFIFAVTANAIQILLIIEANYRMKLTSKRRR